MSLALRAQPDRLLARLRALERERTTFEAHWQLIRGVLLPLIKSFQSIETKGQRSGEEILDSHGMTAVERLAAGLDGMLTNPATEWFALRPADPALRVDNAGSKWLERVAEIMISIFSSPASGFNASKNELFLSEVAFGTAVLYVADRPGKLPLYETRPLAECFLTEGEDGRVDGVWRKFQMTARQAVEKWDERVGERILRAAREDPDRSFDFLHAVYPRGDARAGYPVPSRHLPYASVWLSLADKTVIDERGYHEMPYMVPRWRTMAGEVYGRGPGMAALADSKMLQGMAHVTLRAGELAVAPPLMVADDGVVQVPNLRPAAINYYRTGVWNQDPIKALDTGGRPDIGLELIEAWRRNLDKVFYLDLLAVMQDPKMTATQIIKLDEETLRILGPIVGRLQAELLAPLIERTFAIALRARMLPDPPPSLAGQELRIEYLSPLARAQRFGQVTAIGRTLELISPLAAQDPAVMDVFDVEAMVRHIAAVTGVPAALMRDPDQVEEMRAGRQQVQGEQASMQQMIEAAPGAAKLLEAAGKTGMLPPGGMGGPGMPGGMPGGTPADLAPAGTPPEMAEMAEAIPA